MARYNNLLLEYNRDITAQRFGKAVAKHAEQSTDDHPVIKALKQGDHGKFYDAVENADPTPKKKYVPAMVGLIAKGGLNRFEDIGRLKAAVKQHHELSSRNKLKPEHRDLNSFSHLSHLEDAMDQYEHVQSGKEKKAEVHQKASGDSTVTKHDTFTHVIPHTMEASKHWGKGTRWCTASTNDEDNMFNHYASEGPMHIYIPHTPHHDREKYQYHYSSGQLMNEKDGEVSVNTLRKRHPDIADHISAYAKQHDDLLAQLAAH